MNDIYRIEIEEKKPEKEDITVRIREEEPIRVRIARNRIKTHEQELRDDRVMKGMRLKRRKEEEKIKRMKRNYFIHELEDSMKIDFDKFLEMIRNVDSDMKARIIEGLYKSYVYEGSFSEAIWKELEKTDLWEKITKENDINKWRREYEKRTEEEKEYSEIFEGFDLIE